MRKIILLDEEITYLHNLLGREYKSMSDELGAKEDAPLLERRRCLSLLQKIGREEEERTYTITTMSKYSRSTYTEQFASDADAARHCEAQREHFMKYGHDFSVTFQKT